MSYRRASLVALTDPRVERPYRRDVRYRLALLRAVLRGGPR